MPNAPSPFHAYIDYPTAASVLSGTPVLSGWALNDNGAVSLVTISVDGVPSGSTIDSVSRGDVCAVYPGRANCPKAGWTYYNLNTLQLADGKHTLDVTVTSGSQHATFSTSFTVANNSANSTLMDVDQPALDSGPLTGTVTVSGWAVDDRGSSNLSIQIDGVFWGANGLFFSQPRPDVCNVYPGRPGCPNVGWSYPLDTTLIPDGVHTLTVIDRGTATQSVSRKINVANGNNVVPKLKLYIDQPNSNSPILQGIVRASGWIIATASNFNFFPYVSLDIDGAPVTSFVFPTQPRADVCAVFTTARNCPVVGWTALIDTTQFMDGTHTLHASPTDSDIATLASTPITIGNSVVLNPMHLAIDGSASILSGTANLYGWAVSDDAAINTVSVAVDGAALGNASYGDSRNEVCEIYQNRLGCPNVGWRLAIDTTKLSNGSHTVSVTATSSLGEQATQTGTAIVNN